MAKFSFHGDITGDHHQFGDHNTQVNKWFKENEMLELDQQEIDSIKKIAQNLTNLETVKKIFESIRALEKRFGAVQERKLPETPKKEVANLLQSIRHLIKKDQLEEAITLLEEYLSKIQDEEGLNQLIILQSNVKNISDQYKMGTQGYEEMQVFRNRAYFRLLAMVPEVSE